MIPSSPPEHFLLRELIQTQSRELFRHSYAVASLAGNLAESIGCSSAEQERIQMGSLLHDIGKQFIPASLLEKQGELSAVEYYRVQQHAWLGYAYLNSLVSDAKLLDTVLYHHEHWAGSGYPYGLQGEQIPLGARVCALADVWDALLSKRCYHHPWSLTEAAEYIWSRAGSFFDPALAHQFLNIIEMQAESYSHMATNQTRTLPLLKRHTSSLERLPLPLGRTRRHFSSLIP